MIFLQLHLWRFAKKLLWFRQYYNDCIVVQSEKYFLSFTCNYIFGEDYRNEDNEQNLHNMIESEEDIEVLALGVEL